MKFLLFGQFILATNPTFNDPAKYPSLFERSFPFFIHIRTVGIHASLLVLNKIIDMLGIMDLRDCE